MVTLLTASYSLIVFSYTVQSFLLSEAEETVRNVVDLVKMSEYSLKPQVCCDRRSACSSDPPKDLQRCQHSRYDVAHRMDLGHCGQRDLDCPGEAEDHVFYDGTVVVGLDTEDTG